MSNPYQTPDQIPDAMSAPVASWDDIRIVNSGQKFLVGGFVTMILLSVAFAVFSASVELPSEEVEAVVLLAVLMAILIALFCTAYGVFRMGKVVNPGISRYIMTIGCILPYVSLLVIIFSNYRANKFLKAQGYKVGFFGAKLK